MSDKLLEGVMLHEGLRSAIGGPYKRVTWASDKPSMTKQSFKKECDVNQIVKKYEMTGYLEHVTKGEPQYGDFTQVQDYASAMAQVRQAEESFMMLPARVRDRFSNDPGAFVAFMEDPANGKAIVELGLGTRSESDRPVATESTQQQKSGMKAAASKKGQAASTDAE